MKIGSLTLSGFRCFAPDPVAIELDDLSCFIGPNASGKTATLLALVRLFGVTPTERTLVPGDFHLGPGEKLDDQNERALSLEVRLEFPELEDDDAVPGRAIPESFNQMVVDAPGASPFCRMRLDAVWTADGTAEGAVEQNLYWIRTDSVDEEEIAAHRNKVSPADRGMIQVIYVPATRDPAQQARGVSKTALGRLVRAVDWSDYAKDSVARLLGRVRTKLGDEAAIELLNESLNEAWQDAYDGQAFAETAVEAVSQDISDIVRQMRAVFRPDDTGDECEVDALSDGLRSLFYFTFIRGVFKIERRLADAEDVEELGFSPDRLRLPALTVFAAEEPENHLSPHYLGRLIQLLEALADDDAGQVALTSHSPCIVRRVDPRRVRYFLGHEHTAHTQVKPILLPADDPDAEKYIREGVRAYPELYFSRAVVLGEGASEEIVLPRLFEASGNPVDTSFISVVPLGGRHVNHLWRLLTDLSIPHVTLLDLDREREHGGWARIHYVCAQLLARGVDRDELLEMPDAHGDTHVLNDDEFDGMLGWDANDKVGMRSWITDLEQYNVFLSCPLDLDLLMLKEFPNEYQESATGEPCVPEEETPAHDAYIKKAIARVLGDPSEDGEEAGYTYPDQVTALFPWYRYLFLDHSKPSTHVAALARIDNESLLEHAPPVLKRLCRRLNEIFTPTEEPGDGEDPA